MWIPRPDGKYVFHRFSADPYQQGHQAVVARIVDSSGLGNICTRLEPDGSLSGAFCRGKSSWHLMLVWTPYVHPSLRVGIS
jgi:hypothetical protein